MKEENKKIKKMKDDLWSMQTSKLISNEERSVIVRPLNIIEDKLKKLK